MFLHYQVLLDPGLTTLDIALDDQCYLFSNRSFPWCLELVALAF